MAKSKVNRKLTSGGSTGTRSVRQPKGVEKNHLYRPRPMSDEKKAEIPGDDEAHHLVLVIATVDGCETTHKYPVVDLDLSDEEIREIVKNLVDKIADALGGKRPSLFLKHPTVAYASNHIVRASFDAVGAKIVLEQVGFRT